MRSQLTSLAFAPFFPDHLMLSVQPGVWHIHLLRLLGVLHDCVRLGLPA